METFFFRAFDPEEGRSPAFWDIAPEMSNFAIFGFYLEN
jgi:hypothetical protein